MKIAEYASTQTLASSDLLIVETSSGTRKISGADLKNETKTDTSTIETDIDTLKSNKVDKVEGKGLSTNDYTDDEKDKLSGLSNYDDSEIKSDIGDLDDLATTEKSNLVGAINEAYNHGGSGSGVPDGGTTGQVLRKQSDDDGDADWDDIPEVPAGGATGQVLTKKSNDDGDFEWQTPAGSGDMLKSVYDADNDGVVDNASKVNNHTVLSDVPDSAVFTDTVYNDTEIRGLIDGKLDANKVGVAGGVASLDSTGLVPASQLPSFVDDVIDGYYNNVTDKFYEDASFTREIEANTGKIYVDLYTNKTYRWSGSVFVEISESLALGETSSTAYRGDRGKTAYDTASANATAISALKNDISKVETSTTASNSYTAGDLMIIGNNLYSVKEDIAVGGTIVVGTNVEITTLSREFSKKEGELTFDATPIENGSNPVTSGGIYAALSLKQNTLTFDSTPTNGSNNPVTSSGLYSALSTKLDSSKVGTSGGVAELDENGMVPASQLPSFVDDVVEGYFNEGSFYKEVTFETAIPGETGKIYIDLLTNKTYRWSGSTFVIISESIALGETSSTAYRGDRGKTAYDDSQANKTNIGIMANLGTTEKGSLVGAINEVNSKANITWDSTPTEDSTNGITSGAVYDAISAALGQALNTSY